MGELRPCKKHSEKVTHASKKVENEVARVGGEEDIIWRVLHDGILNRVGVIMLGDATIGLVCTVTKLRVNCGEDLLRRSRRTGVYEMVVIIRVILAEDGVLGGSCDGGRAGKGGC